MAERTSWGPAATASADSTASDHLLPYEEKQILDIALSDCCTCPKIIHWSHPEYNFSSRNHCLNLCIILHPSEGSEFWPAVGILMTRTIKPFSNDIYTVECDCVSAFKPVFVCVSWQNPNQMG